MRDSCRRLRVDGRSSKPSFERSSDYPLHRIRIFGLCTLLTSLIWQQEQAIHVERNTVIIHLSQAKLNFYRPQHSQPLLNPNPTHHSRPSTPGLVIPINPSILGLVAGDASALSLQRPLRISSTFPCARSCFRCGIYGATSFARIRGGEG